MRPATKYVIDDVDELNDNIELSHHEDKGYNEVIDFDQLEPETTLDLTWMKSKDSFVLKNSDKFSTLNEVAVNINNLPNSELITGINAVNLKIINSKKEPSEQSKSFINIIFKNKDKDNSVALFKDFIDKNKVYSVTFVGFDEKKEHQLMEIAEEKGIIVANNSLTNGLHKHM